MFLHADKAHHIVLEETKMIVCSLFMFNASVEAISFETVCGVLDFSVA